MATKKKMLQAAAGNAGGEALNVEDVFSTYLYTGNGSTQTITNGIDLDGEGGMIWQKNRTGAYSHSLVDTERGGENTLQTNGTDAQVDRGNDFVTSFNSDGFSIGADALINFNTYDFASWTFRKAPKFFDVVTYTGNGVAGREIAHNLGTTVGSIFIKQTNTSGGDWIVYHRSEAGKRGYLNQTGAFTTSYAQYYYGNNIIVIPPTSTEFTVGNAGGPINASGGTYVAYLFAHNDGDGEFGPDGDADIIKCGSYTGNGSADGPEIDLGFEPQWVMVKDSSAAGPWVLGDVMRGLSDSSGKYLYANTSDAETSYNWLIPKANGFKLTNTGTDANASGDTYIYIAIRRGTKVPESGTEVFASYIAGQGASDPALVSGFVTDFATRMYRGGGIEQMLASRLQGNKYLETSNNAVEQSAGLYWDYQTGWYDGLGNSLFMSHMWKRAPGFCDVVAYTGQLNLANPATFTVPHNLGVIPELVIVKSRTTANKWSVGSTLYPNGGNMVLNESGGIEGPNSTFRFNYAGWTDSLVSFGSDADVGRSGQDYIAYLFASLDGISKVFSVTKSSGSDASVNCGFSSGPRFVMLKRTDSTGDWYVWDTERGIVVGNDPYLLLNSTAAEVTSTDYIDPTSNGFTIVNGGLADGDYIGYAVA